MKHLKIYEAFEELSDLKKYFIYKTVDGLFRIVEILKTVEIDSVSDLQCKIICDVINVNNIKHIKNSRSLNLTFNFVRGGTLYTSNSFEECIEKAKKLIRFKNYGLF